MVSPERVAFELGLKPALRLYAEPSDAEQLQRSLLAAGHAVEVQPLSSGKRLVYVARTARDALRLRALESTILPGGPSRPAARNVLEAHRALGLALGYPSCCVEAFVGRVQRDVRRARDGSLAHEDFVAIEAAASNSRAHHAWLNPVPLDGGSTVVSFYPCALDCEAALALARELFAAFRSRHPGEAVVRHAALSTPLFLARDGTRRPPGGTPADVIRLDRWTCW
ncbi:MAG: hypothetical protein NZ898_00840 [Myxococcota bacterium]|nr:hypothetical protein [Myxococcota bacterium]MDW8364082.1 hypothetical protein [Myxococcales bacterium]